MSHFTRLTTKMTQAAYVEQAARELGLSCRSEQVTMHNEYGESAEVDMVVTGDDLPGPVGLAWDGSAYEIVADWYVWPEKAKEEFIRRLVQRYAYVVTKALLAKQQFQVVGEQVDEAGRIHLALRRWT